MRHYQVTSPLMHEQEVASIGLATDPPEPFVCFVTVVAESKRDARRIAIQHDDMAKWVDECRSDSRNPMARLEVTDMTCEHGICMCELCYTPEDDTRPGGDCGMTNTSATAGHTIVTLSTAAAVSTATIDAGRHEGWHILPNDGRLANFDNRKVVKGRWLGVEGELSLCARGMHWSPRLLDAVQYAAGSVICRVEVDTETVHGSGSNADKACSRRRRVLWMLTADEGERVLRTHARQSAADVAHLWDPPEVVIRWIETGDESLRAAAWDAAWDAAWAAARDAAWAAARAAAWAAARAAAWDAAWAAARAAAWAAARDAAWAAARAAAWAAARAAAWDAQNENIERMALAAHEGRWNDVAVVLPPTWGETRAQAGMAVGEAQP